MSQQDPFADKPLDPYVASSLMQKAIRRGEGDQAFRAASQLARHRGKGVWRRLLIVAFEDVGAGDANLVFRTTELIGALLKGGHPSAEPETLERVCHAMADTPKSRTADYLYSAAAPMREASNCFSTGSLISIAADPDRSLADRAAAILGQAPVQNVLSTPSRQRLRRASKFLAGGAAPAMESALVAFDVVKHPFVLLLPLILSAIEETATRCEISQPDLPVQVSLAGVPSYAFDMHTSVGKRAISLFSKGDEEVRDVLATYVAPGAAVPAACMAAFYADGAPVAQKIVWPGSELLERGGFEADMLTAGCPRAGVDPVFSAVRANLAHLNELRAELMGVRVRQ